MLQITSNKAMHKMRGHIMLNNYRILSISLCVCSLSACTIDDTTTYTNDQLYQPYTYSSTRWNPQGYENTGYTELPQDQKPVEVPESYHVSATHAPTSHTDLDHNWVNSQNAQAYTIELSNSDKASQVAGTLFKAPKNERTAEIKYQHDGKTYYKGLYGSYPSHEAAQQALDALPADVKPNAGIKTWGSIQSGINK